MIFTVAIDGPAAAGKGTISRAVAARFGFAHLDTGLLYRAVGALGGDPEPRPAQPRRSPGRTRGGEPRSTSAHPARGPQDARPGRAENHRLKDRVAAWP